MIVEKEILENTFNGNVIETAVQLRESVQTIMASLTKYNISFEKPKHIFSGLRDTDFSGFQKSLLVGSILGDGHLEKRAHLSNAIFREEHSVKQVEWLKWKHSNLKPFTTANMWIRDRGNTAMFPDGHGKKKQYTITNVCAISTNTHPYLTYLYKMFYLNNKKIISFDFMKKNFNELCLLVWICDDGYYDHKRNCVVLCTENFSYPEIKILSECISAFNIKNSIVRHSIKKDTYRIYISNFSSNVDLREYGFNVLPKCMHHKVSPVLNEHQVATHAE